MISTTKLLLVTMTLNGCPHEVVIGNRPGVPLGCDRRGGGGRLKCISSTLKNIHHIVSVRHLSKGIGCRGCRGRGGNQAGRGHWEWLFYSSVWFSSQVNMW